MDLDGDGRLDILSGSYSRMDNDMAGLFQVLRGKADGTFNKAEVLNGTDGKPLILPVKDSSEIVGKICTRPFAIDWDADGRLDIVTGNFAGTFLWIKGEGKGRFSPKAEPLLADDGKPLRIPGAHSDPFVIDFDGDGDLDIVSGSSNGGVYQAENTAGKGKPPKLKQFRTIIEPSKPHGRNKALREADVKAPSHATRVWVADVNGDGKLDLLVGDSVTLVSPAKGLSDADMEKKFPEWEKELNKASAAYQKAMNEEEKAANEKDKASRSKAMQEASAAFQKVYQTRKEFVNEEMTGFVWLYLQK